MKWYLWQQKLVTTSEEIAKYYGIEKSYVSTYIRVYYRHKLKDKNFAILLSSRQMVKDFSKFNNFTPSKGVRMYLYTKEIGNLLHEKFAKLSKIQGIESPFEDQKVQRVTQTQNTGWEEVKTVTKTLQPKPVEVKTPLIHQLSTEFSSMEEKVVNLTAQVSEMGRTQEQEHRVHEQMRNILTETDTKLRQAKADLKQKEQEYMLLVEKHEEEKVSIKEGLFLNMMESFDKVRKDQFSVGSSPKFKMDRNGNLNAIK